MVTNVPLFDPTPVAVKTGRKHLYDTHKTSGLGQAACASCHVDGRFDRLAWDLGNPTGTMNTLAELDAYFPLHRLGAVVVKSLAAEPWPGNPAPRLHEVGGGMLNSVGLQGPGVAAWLATRPSAPRSDGAKDAVPAGAPAAATAPGLAAKPAGEPAAGKAPNEGPAPVDTAPRNWLFGV